jgi:hypothetical protein
MAITLNEVIRKSRMKREFQVRFRERVGAIRPPLYSTLFFLFFCRRQNSFFIFFVEV